jgi:single-strand DNA-binding protein
MNQVNLIGRLTRDPELRKLGDSDRDVCELRIAVDNGKSRDGADREATFVDVSTFDAAARACTEHLNKGRQVAVSGRLVYRQWEADDGSKRSKHSVIGRVEFLGSRNGAANSKPEPAAVGGDDADIPF